MHRDINFMALGGGQSVGNSCYLLQLGKENILLDCGSSAKNSFIRGPNFLPLFQEAGLHSLKEISAVFISHAHLDHVGYLPQLLLENPKLQVYMTGISEMFTRYQLLDRNSELQRDGEKRLVLNSLLDNIHNVNYWETRYFNNYSATFYQAGHIPGAMMIMFEYKGQHILYTGDYSFGDTLLTPGCMLPDNLKVDVMLMCGLHAKHADYKATNNQLQRNVAKIMQLVAENRNVFCRVSQLSKGIELLVALNKAKEERGLRVPIYIDNALMGIVENLERARVAILKEGNFLIRNGKKPIPHITLVQGDETIPDANEQAINVDFTLHDDFEEMVGFIKAINPKKAFVVHCSSAGAAGGETVEDRLFWDVDCQTEFFFPEEGYIFNL